MHSPVVIITYNRPDRVRRLLEEVRRAQPPAIYVLSDGPKASVFGDFAVVGEVRRQFDIAWADCRRRYVESNVGLGRNISEGLDWVFSEVDEALILEDDCLPSQSFFGFADELLTRYRYDHRVMMISGNNLTGEDLVSPASYGFSYLAGTWGWATWRRAWNLYDQRMPTWPVEREKRTIDKFLPVDSLAYWYRLFDAVHSRSQGCWDYQWLYQCLIHGGFRAMPIRNLVTNVGFGQGATNTRSQNRLSALPLCDLELPLRHPRQIDVCRDWDRMTYEFAHDLNDRRPAYRRVASRTRTALRRGEKR